MVVQLNKIFLGSAASEHRKYLADVLKYFKKQGYKKVTIPAVGVFGLAKAAIVAGFQPSQIYTSDISLFSSVLGYLYSGKEINSLPIKQDIKDTLNRQYETEAEKAADLILLIKLNQLDTNKYYQEVIYDDIAGNFGSYVKKMAAQLNELKKPYEGINYEIKDLWKELSDDSGVIVLNPPVYKGGYEKLYDEAEEFVGFDNGIQQFDHKLEFESLYAASRDISTPIILMSHDSKGVDKKDIVCAVEKGGGLYESWVVNKTSYLEGYQDNVKIIYKKVNELKGLKAPVMVDADEITEDSKISFKQVKKEVGLYYRDLFAHRLGNTMAEIYLLMLIDGKVFGTIGLHAAELRRLTSNYIFEVFGFNAPLKKYPRVNRLMMMAITSKEFGEWLENSRILGNKNAIYDLRGLKTTCLSKYRKVKLNNGILKVKKREKMPNGLYKILYVKEWFDRTYQDCVKIYLSELEG